MNRITIQVCSRDRHSEVALLLQSLRSQTYQDWDIILLDDASGTPLTQCNFIIPLINRIKFEGHKVKLIRNEFSKGVCGARNKLIEVDTYNNAYACRLDDDVVVEPDYLERLVKVIEQHGYDMATGVVPLVANPEFERDTELLDKTICLHKFDEEGNLIERKDELAYCYTDEAILDCDQFRTNCLYKSEIQEKIKYPDTLSHVGFREELWFSFRARIQGYKIGADLNAKAFHFQTPSGGTRSGEYSQNVALDEETTNNWLKKMYKEHGDFLK